MQRTGREIPGRAGLGYVGAKSQGSLRENDGGSMPEVHQSTNVTNYTKASAVSSAERERRRKTAFKYGADCMNWERTRE